MSGNFDFLDGPRRRSKRSERRDDTSAAKSDFLFAEPTLKPSSKRSHKRLFFEEGAQQAPSRSPDLHGEAKFIEVESPKLSSGRIDELESRPQPSAVSSIWETAEDEDWAQLAKIDPELAAELYLRSDRKSFLRDARRSSTPTLDEMGDGGLSSDSRAPFENLYIASGEQRKQTSSPASANLSSNPYLDGPELEATPYLSYFSLDHYPNQTVSTALDRRFPEATEPSSLEARRRPKRSLREQIKRGLRILKISLILASFIAVGLLFYLFRAGYTPIRLKMMLELQEGKSEAYQLRKNLIGPFPESVDYVYALSRSPSPKRADFSFEFPKRDLGLVPLSQYDPRWAFEPYNGVFLGDSGSGPLCLASLALSDQNQGLHPLAIAAYMKASSFDVGESGTSPEGIDAFASQFLPALKSIPSQRSALEAACTRGKIVLIESCDEADSNRLDNGYYLLLHLDHEGRGTVYDPRKPSSRNRSINLESILSKLQKAWVYEN
ncbi:MAG: hypothetical protein Q4P72_00650 [Eubacteriales bacterium]|nr:hypothetical protein [Eubacteriales bacterium]